MLFTKTRRIKNRKTKKKKKVMVGGINNSLKVWDLDLFVRLDVDGSINQYQTLEHEPRLTAIYGSTTEKINNRLKFFENDNIMGETAENIWNIYFSSLSFGIIKVKRQVNPLNENKIRQIKKNINGTINRLNEFNDDFDTRDKSLYLLKLHGDINMANYLKPVPERTLICNLNELENLFVTSTRYNKKEDGILNFFLETLCENTKYIESLFKHRALHSVLEKIISKVDSQLDICFDCLNKSTWFYPGQKYIDINLTADNDEIRFLYTLTQSGPNKYSSNTEEKEPTYNSSLSKLIADDIDKHNPSGFRLIFLCQCLPLFNSGDDDIENIFKYYSIIYDLNSSIENTIQSSDNDFKHINKAYCRTENNLDYLFIINDPKSLTFEKRFNNDNFSRKIPYFEALLKSINKGDFAENEFNFVSNLSFSKTVKIVSKIYHRRLIKNKKNIEKFFKGLI